MELLAPISKRNSFQSGFSPQSASGKLATIKMGQQVIKIEDKSRLRDSLLDVLETIATSDYQLYVQNKPTLSETAINEKITAAIAAFNAKSHCFDDLAQQKALVSYFRDAAREAGQRAASATSCKYCDTLETVIMVRDQNEQAVENRKNLMAAEQTRDARIIFNKLDLEALKQLPEKQ